MLSGKTRFMHALLSRMKNILVHPKAEWQVIKDETKTLKQVIVGYVAVLAAVPLAVSGLEAIEFGSGTTGNGSSFSMGSLLMEYVPWYLMIIIDIMILGSIINALIPGQGSSQNQGFKIAAYSATPLMLVGIARSLPKAAWLAYVAILYSVYLLFLGISSLTAVGQRKAAWFAIASFLAASVIVGILNLFEYLFESYLMRKLILPG